MITKLFLSEIIRDQKEGIKKKNWTERDTELPSGPKRIIIISGVRRCGKSTLIQQKLMNKDAIYLNFEDPRLIDFSLEDFSQLEKIAVETGKTRFLLDEVQNVEKWEMFARAANEKGFHLFVTGSNAGMLSRELGTKLTGRYDQKELFPFSFNEFLSFHHFERNLDSFNIYFNTGGFPEYLEERDDNYLRTLLRDIITRDITVRRNISNENLLIRLAIHLLSNIGKEFSYNGLSKLLEIKSVRSVIDYCDYLNEAYIIDFIPQFSASIKKQLINPKKCYCVDHGLARANSISFSTDSGRRLENIVYNKLRHEYKDIYYFRSGRGTECDFIVKRAEKAELAVQSCWEINRENQKRELNGIRDAMSETGAGKAFIITHHQEDIIDGINLIPAWQWI